MGATVSHIYGHCRRLAIRYNAENRAHKFLDKGNLPKAPKHPIRNRNPEEFVLSEEQLKEIHGKNLQLYEYLKKVYLTSTSKVIGIASKRPKPKKENEEFKTQMFCEPKTPAPGCCTLSNVMEILMNFQKDAETFSASYNARTYNMDKKDIRNLVMYYSLFTLEKFDFMNAVPITPEKREPAKEQKVQKKIQEKPLKQIERE